jgi:DNA-binding LytR/AlgR family response regulator
MVRPATLAALAGVALLATLAGLFDSDAWLRPVPRFGYWLVMAGATYAAGCLAAGLVEQHHVAKRSPRTGAVVSALAVGVAVPPVVLVVNWALLGHPPRTEGLGGFLLSLFAIATVTGGLLQLADRPGTEVAVAAPAASLAPDLPPPAPPILDRLPVDRRGALVAVSVEDHYVRIRTTAGEALVLMRLTDAMRETQGVPGLQVHRSHWVATGQVRAVRRRGDGAVLTMATGPEVPVSRAHLPALRTAGLLPR